MKFSGIEPIIGLLAAIGWWIIKAIYDRRRDAEMWEEMEETQPTRPAPPRPPAPPPPLVMRPQQIPKAPLPPPIVVRKPEPIRPVFIDEPEGPARRNMPQLKHAQESYTRAAHLQQSVANRLRAIDQQTAAAKPIAPAQRIRPPAAAHILRTFRNPSTIRQAFLAQFVLNPPKALE